MRGIKAVKTLFSQFDRNYSAVARHIGGDVYPIEISRAINDGYVSGKIVRALESKGYLEKEQRHRVWMRTDNLSLAIAQLKKHYPEVVFIITDRDRCDSCGSVLAPSCTVCPIIKDCKHE